MYQLLSSSALLIFLLLGASAKTLRRHINFQQLSNSIQLKTQKTDYFPEPPYCGVGKNSKAPNRIAGGTEVMEGEFPWMVSFPQHCGGTLINSRWVLSAAHCFVRVNLEKVVANLGALDCKPSDNGRICESAEKFKVKNVIRHEQFENGYPYPNDIALVQLSRSVIFSDEIQPICLPYYDELINGNIVDQDAVVSGWGRTENDVEEGHLLKTTVKIWNADKCEDFDKIFKTKYYEDIRGREKFYMTREQHICAGGIKGVGTCSGDSGGPLFLQLQSSKDDNTAHYYQVGITSFGPPCGIENEAGVYANVSTYIPWIRKTILANE